jgi:light-regulated signal transduction histidine kinase (bacteriophytochrome)
LNDFSYREPFLASRSVAADLLEEAKIEIQKERKRNQLFIRWLIGLLTVVVVLLFFVFYGYKKLKKSTTYNNWITTALSHDLRSPVAHIAYSLNQPNGIHTAKANLMSYEYLLDDTLSMALRIHHNREIQFKSVDLIDLLDEIMLDLKFIIYDKQLIIERNLQNELIVKGDYTGLKILLRNVFHNAIKHNKENGFISIKSAPNEPKKIIIKNTINSLSQTKNATAGEEIINFFSRENKVNYAFYIVDDTAYSELNFS